MKGAKDGYHGLIPCQQFPGGSSDYITRKSKDNVWSVKHQEALWDVTLKFNGKEYKWDKVSYDYDIPFKLMTSAYYTCIPWK
ncbi:hypothetical protein BGX30_005963 [Mortierella sp. GBA39]|nr:hypothetical protein BGX30_005963 [Mortierella sp. GBA39]